MIMNLVEVKEFSFAYPECSRKVLDHANLKIEEGTLNVICGRSGCGKSTLLRQLKTVLAPVGKSEGEIVPEDTVQLAKKVLDKIALEGGKEALQSHLWNRFTVGTSPAASCYCCSTAPISPSA